MHKDNYIIMLTITPVENINYTKYVVIDVAKVETKIFGWDEIINVFVTFNSLVSKVVACDVSLYDHRLILDNKKYHIIHFLSKNIPAKVRSLI